MRSLVVTKELMIFIFPLQFNSSINMSPSRPHVPSKEFRKRQVNTVKFFWNLRIHATRPLSNG